MSDSTTACDLSKLQEIFGAGLTDGLGDVDGQTCIEGAIALASGEGLNDAPACVAKEDRVWAININDARWSSPEARADALLPIALMQIGTAGADRSAWAKAVVIGTVLRVLPMALRSAAWMLPDSADSLEDSATRCEAATTLEAAADAAYAAADAVLHEAVSVALDAYRKECRA